MGGGGPAPRVLQLEVPETPPSGPSQVSPYTLQGCFHFQGSPEPNSVCLLVTYKVPETLFQANPSLPRTCLPRMPWGLGPSFSQSSPRMGAAQVHPGADQASGPSCGLCGQCLVPKGSHRSGQLRPQQQPQSPGGLAVAWGSQLGWGSHRTGRRGPQGELYPKHVREPQHSLSLAMSHPPRDPRSGWPDPHLLAQSPSPLGVPTCGHLGRNRPSKAQSDRVLWKPPCLLGSWGDQVMSGGTCEPQEDGGG